MWYGRTTKCERDYRVRALNARIQSMRRTPLMPTCKDEVVEPHTIAIIAKKVSRVYYYLL